MWGRKIVPVVLFGASLFFNMGFFSFCDTFFFICAVLFLFFAGHLHCHRALGKRQGTGFSIMKLNMQAQKNWQLFKIVCECLACLDHKFTVFSEFVSTSEVHHIPSVGATIWRATKASTSLCSWDLHFCLL